MKWWTMKRVVGLIMFFIGVGILLGIWISQDWIKLCLAVGLMCCGFRLFCCK
ncbi:MAG: hypothetical protein PUB24_09370 [Lachnospiraceae bacterium]|nr:hypothetical protein [Lachnospiraceae bacterium]MDD6193260.1 hypothetical protein [Lachnospiraceae bacterium]MDY4794188.1 hypothetical protein [Pararoseburia sp.]